MPGGMRRSWALGDTDDALGVLALLALVVADGCLEHLAAAPRPPPRAPWSLAAPDGTADTRPRRARGGGRRLLLPPHVLRHRNWSRARHAWYCSLASRSKARISRTSAWWAKGRALVSRPPATHRGLRRLRGAGEALAGVAEARLTAGEARGARWGESRLQEVGATLSLLARRRPDARREADGAGDGDLEGQVVAELDGAHRAPRHARRAQPDARAVQARRLARGGEPLARHAAGDAHAAAEHEQLDAYDARDDLRHVGLLRRAPQQVAHALLRRDGRPVPGLSPPPTWAPRPILSGPARPPALEARGDAMLERQHHGGRPVCSALASSSAISIRLRPLAYECRRPQVRSSRPSVRASQCTSTRTSRSSGRPSGLGCNLSACSSRARHSANSAASAAGGCAAEGCRRASRGRRSELRSPRDRRVHRRWRFVGCVTGVVMSSRVWLVPRVKLARSLHQVECS